MTSKIIRIKYKKICDEKADIVGIESVLNNKNFGSSKESSIDELIDRVNELKGEPSKC